MTDRITTGPLAGLLRNGYGAIVADPPWTFQTRSDEGKDRSPEQHYECMSLDDIKALPVRDIAAKDCVLFLWVIDTHLPMALDVITAWGFTYKTKAFNWCKLNRLPENEFLVPPVNDPSAYFTGMGFWTRANPEDCLLATRGSPKRQDKGVRRLIVSERREHSRKPDEVLARVEKLVPGPYCELFSRTPRAGWDQMGNEPTKFRPVDDFSDVI
jgi:N6-adenosine-specific RNA methylase IME4